MKERLRRSVFVDAPLDVAWNYLSKPEEWPQSWAGHLKRVECNPPGAVTEKTHGVLHMKEGFKSRLTTLCMRFPQIGAALLRDGPIDADHSG
jgi:hypothetical protein